eukprot:12080375-Karenia_brevis.AAC.1
MDVTYSSLLNGSSDKNPFEAIAKYSDIIRRAAAETRNFLMLQGNSVQSDDLLFTTVSRCVFHNDVPMGHFLLRNYPRVAQHIVIRGNNVV